MEKENGAVLKAHLAIFTMGNTKTIVNMALVASYGQVVTNTKESI
jgi:hypothetical protein